MSDDKRLDEEISRLVRSVERDVPPAVEASIRGAAEAIRPRPRFFGRHRRPAWVLSRRGIRTLALASGAACVIVVLGALLFVPALRKPPAPRISEIRTEFEIADKNIKIVFVQRPDFKLTQEE
jgi:hypothetical protein